jgi:hypothetical protein
MIMKVSNGVLIMVLVTLALARGVWADKKASLSREAYAQILSRHVNEKGLVDYKGLREDRAALDIYVDQMAELPSGVYEGLSDKGKIAFWINAYNALTLKAVIDHYPVESIKEIGSMFQSVWDKLKFQVMGREMTLNEIEHEVLRKQFTEPRIHMAINCASMGCPPLATEPFTAERLDEQFDDRARRFLANPTNFRIDREKGRIYLSSIFKWFGEDFVSRYGSGGPRPGLGEKENAVLNYIGTYVEGRDREFLNGSELKIKYLDYDWSLNEQP